MQLLTPEGERVEHPTYSVDLTDEELRGLYRDLVLVRRFDAEATALQRQGELGIWASLLGQEAAQVGSGRALRDDDYAFPTYREHGVAWCRGVDPLNLLGLFRGVNHGGWDPNEQELPPLHDRHRRADAARHRLRHGHAEGRRRRARSSPTSATAPPARATSTRRSSSPRLQRAGRVLLPEQPVGHLRADREADPHPALPARAGLRLPRRPGRRQRRARRASPSPRRRWRTPARATARPWSRRSPTGWARTPPPTTRPATGSPTSSSRGRLKDPIERLKAYLVRTGIADQAFFDALEAETDELAAHVRKGCLEMPDPEPLSIFDHVYAERAPARRRGARAVRRLPRRRSRARRAH